jgi:hypothetical protein
MYEMMSKWDSVSTQLPALVSRMVGLRAVHEDAARFASAISALDREQGATHALLKDNAELIATLDASFKVEIIIWGQIYLGLLLAYRFKYYIGSCYLCALFVYYYLSIYYSLIIRLQSNSYLYLFFAFNYLLILFM